ncbi:hypothetical protein CSAL01_11848 [Colletotrichum salicis]|uniref:Alpha-L-rhamnosidase C-terminal domain-containing protein n=1 Tax=Colletotrichum salicis TaxID=1209931 RepID=A0A135RU59_9PEZI|nr:hypothetical protein CSAL01_11848 [Colletotrichum salicis]
MDSSNVALLEPSRLVSISNGARRDAESGVVTLTNGELSESSKQASITFDYGRCVGGLPSFMVDRASGEGPIKVRILYSETIEGIECETGDGPYFFFSNAMDCYRNVVMTITPSESQQTINPRLAQRSQRYLKVILITSNATLVINKLGFEAIRPIIRPKASFSCSNEALNRIWNDGVNTLEMCTVVKGETAPAWDITDQGTRVLGQHWAPCRQGTRWSDKEVSFQVLVENLGASWGVHMVANGVIFCLDVIQEELRAFEGLSHVSAVFPVKSFGSWSTHGIVEQGDWIKVSTITSGNRITVIINEKEVATITDVQIRPILGGSGINTGSVAFGGPEGWLALYRNLNAPIHEGSEPPPTYAFYSMTYAFLLVVAIKDYWLNSGDQEALRRYLPVAEKLLKYAESQEKPSGLIEVSPDMSMHWYPLGGPVFGASGTTNLAYYDALNAVKAMTTDDDRKSRMSEKLETLKKSIITNLWNSEKGCIRMGSALPEEGICQDTNGYAIALDVAENCDHCASHLSGPPGWMPVAFTGLQHWDRTGVVSPYATGFAVEALFSRQRGREATQLIENVWGPMADTSSPNYSGGHWEAMTAEGKPFGHDTSLMHAWSCWPVFLLPQYVVGVKPLQPGWSKVQLAPVLSGIKSAHYHTKLSQGIFKVEVSVDETAGVILIQATLPVGTTAEIVAPAGYSNEGAKGLKGPVDRANVTLRRV